MKNRKNHTMDQNTWPVPNALASIIATPPRRRRLRRSHELLT
jgi:hypothetical protein